MVEWVMFMILIFQVGQALPNDICQTKLHHLPPREYPVPANC